MSNSDNERYYATLGLPPDASMDQVKSRYKELSDAYLKLLELSRNANESNKRPIPTDNSAVQAKPNVKQSASPPEKHTEPVTAIREKFTKGKINKTQFEKLVKERYDYLKNKPFSELSDSELEERLKGFDGLNLDPKYWK